MQVKGTAVIPMPAFVKATFGEPGLQRWLGALEPEARALFQGTVMAGAWYDFAKYAVDPTLRICDTFYGGSVQGAFELGRFSADYALRGIYKVFVRLGSPEFTIKQGSGILPKYYDPSKIIVPEVGSGRAVMQITEFPEMHEVVEQRIAGWMTRALELSGAKEGRVAITSTLRKKQPCTEFVLTWR